MTCCLCHHHKKQKKKKQVWSSPRWMIHEKLSPFLSWGFTFLFLWGFYECIYIYMCVCARVYLWIYIPIFLSIYLSIIYEANVCACLHLLICTPKDMIYSMAIHAAMHAIRLINQFQSLSPHYVPRYVAVSSHINVYPNWRYCATQLHRYWGRIPLHSPQK